MARNDNLGSEGDATYTLLMQAHEGLSTEESHALNARLILLMMNEIGDKATIRDLIADAKHTTP